MPNGMYGGVRGRSNSALLDFGFSESNRGYLYSLYGVHVNLTIEAFFGKILLCAVVKLIKK